MWDVTWATLLFGIAGTTEILQKRSSKISYAVLVLLLAGTVSFNRDFSKLSIGPFYVTEVCLAVLMITLGTLVLQHRVQLLPETQSTRRVIVLILAFVCLGTMRLFAGLASDGFGGLLDTLRNFAIVYYALFGIVGWLVMQHAGANKRIRNIFLLILVLSTLAGIRILIYYLAGVTPPEQVGDVMDESKIISGQAVVFAMFSCIIVAQAWRYNVFVRSSWSRVVAICLLLLNLLFIYLSGHRSALLALFASMLTLLIGRGFRMQRRQWSWVVIAIVAAMITWHFLAPDLADFTAKYETLLDPVEEANAAWRLGMWVNVLSVWSGQPVFGVGFAHDFRSEEPWSTPDDDHLAPHNSYLSILARSGAIGFILAGLACLYFVRIMFRAVRHPSSREAAFLSSCILSCFLAIAIFASANVSLENPYHAVFFWLFIGMGVALAPRKGLSGVASISI